MQVAGQPLQTGLSEVQAKTLAKKHTGDEVIVRNDQGTYDVYAVDQLDPKTLEKLKVGSAATSVSFEIEKKGGPGSAARIPQKDFEKAANVLGIQREPGESTEKFNKRVQTEVNRTLLTAKPPDFDNLLVVDGMAGPKTLESLKKAYAAKQAKIETPGFKEDDQAISALKVVAPPPAPKPPPKIEVPKAPTAAGQPDKAADSPPASNVTVTKTPEGQYYATDSETGVTRNATGEEIAAYEKAQPKPFVALAQPDPEPVRPLFGPGGVFEKPGGTVVFTPAESSYYGFDGAFDPTGPKKTWVVPLDPPNPDPFNLGIPPASP